MYVSGFDIIDVHMTDLMSGRGPKRYKIFGCSWRFSNSMFLDLQKDGQGLLYNEKAKVLKTFTRKK